MSKFSINENKNSSYSLIELLDYCKNIYQEIEDSLSDPKGSSDLKKTALENANELKVLINNYYKKSSILSIHELKRNLNKLVSDLYENLSYEIFEYLSKISTLTQPKQIEKFYLTLSKNHPFNITNEFFLLAKNGAILQYNKQQFLTLSEKFPFLLNSQLIEKITPPNSISEIIEKISKINQKTDCFLADAPHANSKIFNDLLIQNLQYEEMLSNFCYQIKINKNEIKMKILIEVKEHCSSLAENIILNLYNINTENLQLFDVSSLHCLINLLSKHNSEFLEKFTFTCYSAILQDQICKLKSCINILSSSDTQQITHEENYLYDQSNSIQTNKSLNEFDIKDHIKLQPIMIRSVNIEIPTNPNSSEQFYIGNPETKKTILLENFELKDKKTDSLPSSNDNSFCFLDNQDEIIDLNEYDIISKNLDLNNLKSKNLISEWTNKPQKELSPTQFDLSPEKLSSNLIEETNDEKEMKSNKPLAKMPVQPNSKLLSLTKLTDTDLPPDEFLLSTELLENANLNKQSKDHKSKLTSEFEDLDEKQLKIYQESLLEPDNSHCAGSLTNNHLTNKPHAAKSFLPDANELFESQLKLYQDSLLDLEEYN